MATIDWPSELPPKPNQEGWQETLRNSIVRSSPDKGLPQTRQRTNAAPRPEKVRVTMTEDQRLVLDSFFCTTLMFGTRRFNWIDPATGEAAEIRFTSSPEISAGAGDIRYADLSIEVMA